jgi:hypothetical protein
MLDILVTAQSRASKSSETDLHLLLVMFYINFTDPSSYYSEMCLVLGGAIIADRPAPHQQQDINVIYNRYFASKNSQNSSWTI